MLYTIHVPFRGPQQIYERFVQSVERQGNVSRELIVANDHYDIEPIKPIKTSFPHKIISIPKRYSGWAYGVGRNVCLDFCTQKAKYLVHVDADWVLKDNSLEDVKPLLRSDTIIQGYKWYANVPATHKKGGRPIHFPEFCIFPLEPVIQCGGWDEIGFPWYGADWHDFQRRLFKIKKFRVIRSKLLYSFCYGSNVKFERDPEPGQRIQKVLEKLGTKKPILRRMFKAEVVYQHGY